MSRNRSRYMLYKKIARGGMAEIYLGKQIGEDGFERICCIKRILPHYAQDNEFIDMFRDEAHICKRLQHANIVRVEGFEEVEGSYAIIMEYVNGGDLRAVLSQCEKDGVRLSAPMALFITAEAARGLHYAHTRVDEITGRALEIVHRDISPQNILLSFEGEVKVTDFGIADTHTKAAETKPGVVKGKYSYMSPEQISAKEVDARTDVFALGIVLREMLAMKRLFQGENEITTIQMVKNCRITQDLRTLNPAVNDELLYVVHRALSRDPRDRYATAADFERELRRYISGNFSDFTTADFGVFLKHLLQKRRKESQEEIKSLLSEDGATDAPAKGVGRRSSTSLAFSIDDSLATPSLLIKPDYTNIDIDPVNSATAFHRQQQGKAQQGAQAPPAQKQQAQPPQAQQHPRQGRAPASSRHAPATEARAVRPSPQRSSNGGGSGKNYRQHRSSKTASHLSDLGMVFITLLITAGVMGLGVSLYKKNISANALYSLEVTTSPDRVKFELDGVALFNNAYVETPKSIPNLSVGDHTLLIKRKDYIDEAYAFRVKPGEAPRPKNVDLAPQREPAPMRIQLANERGGGDRVKIDIDDGSFVDVIDRRPKNIRNIVFMSKVELRVFAGANSNLVAFTCSFVPRSTSWNAPFIVEIHLEKKFCSYPLR